MPGAPPNPAAGIGGGLVGKDLLSDLVPFVEANFRTLKDPANRAIGGLSMGGGHTANISFANPKLFSYVAIMSAGANNADQNYPEFFKSADAINKQFKLLWIGVGKDDFALNGSKALSELLTKHNIKHTYPPERRAARVGDLAPLPARGRAAAVQVIELSRLCGRPVVRLSGGEVAESPPAPPDYRTTGLPAHTGRLGNGTDVGEAMKDESGLTRREFIGATAGATLLSATSLGAAPRGQGANDRVRIGLIGGGSRGRQVAGFMLKHPDAEYLAVADVFKPNVDNAVKTLTDIRPGVKVDAYEDYRRILERKDIDAVHIATPDHWHCRIVVEAIDAGKDVYVEKPLSNNVEEMVKALKAYRGEQSRRPGRHAAAIGSALPGSGRDRPVGSARQDLAGGPALSRQRLRPRRSTPVTDVPGGPELGRLPRAGRKASRTPPDGSAAGAATGTTAAA